MCAVYYGAIHKEYTKINFVKTQIKKNFSTNLKPHLKPEIDVAWA